MKLKIIFKLFSIRLRNFLNKQRVKLANYLSPSLHDKAYFLDILSNVTTITTPANYGPEKHLLRVISAIDLLVRENSIIYTLQTESRSNIVSTKIFYIKKKNLLFK